jgi:hypothetical protein
MVIKGVKPSGYVLHLNIPNYIFKKQKGKIQNCQKKNKEITMILGNSSIPLSLAAMKTNQ